MQQSASEKQDVTYAYPDIKRDSIYIRSGENTLFGWLHASQKNGRGIAAVICNPLGVEYMSGHRSIRHMADQLALQRIAAVRFDYAYTGDSAGGEFSGATASGLVADIRAVVNSTRQITACSSIILIGIGLGATFAALAAETGSATELVLWNPTVSGRRFVREQKLLSEMLTQDGVTNDASVDVAGIFLTPDLQSELRQINLAQTDFSAVRSVLLINRRDMQANPRLTTAIESGGASLEQISMHGYKEMMDYPTDTVVPFAVIDRISSWILTHQPAESVYSNDKADFVEMPKTLALPAGDHSDMPLTETARHFGKDDKLFGIVTLPQNWRAGACRRAFIFLNCGSEHHAGPHRMYTILARKCAGFGALSFRFDIEGIGDSVAAGGNEDNNSYSPVALGDISQALAFIRDEYDCSEFVLSGICAGAYHSFKAMAALEEFNIVEANLVNPLVFEWNYDDPEDHLRLEARTYQKSMRSARNWLSLIKGDIDYHRLLRSLSASLSRRVRSAGLWIFGLFGHSVVSGVSRDMQSITRLGRKFSLLLSDDDPGLELLRIQAPKETKSAIKRGEIQTHILEKANHGLSKKYMQDQLIAVCAEKYAPKKPGLAE